MKQRSTSQIASDLGRRLASLSPAQRRLLQEKLDKKGIDSLLQPAIPRRPAATSAPLSFSQQRLWFLDRYEPGSSLYNLASALRLRGNLNKEALEQSLDEIVRRHEALRTTFSIAGAEPVQIIAPSLKVSLTLIDLTVAPEKEKEEQVRSVAKNEALRPFDLALGPLFRAALIRVAEDDHVLVLAMHHIVSDGWSMGVLYRELGALYGAFFRSRPSPLAEVAIHYADYAAWQLEGLRGPGLESQLSYWKEQLRGSLPVLDLPADYPRAPVQSYRGARHSFNLSEELTHGLKELSQKEGVTLFMTLLAAFQALLHRYTSRDDIVVGSPIANRNRSKVEGLIGFFVNTLVLRTDLSGDPSFRKLLQRVKTIALAAYEHQDLPFEKLVEELNPQRSLSHSPLFQVMFALQNASSAGWRLEGLDVSPFPIAGETAKFDLTVSMHEGAQSLRGSLQYGSDLFRQETIVRMAGHFKVLLDGIVADPERPISALPILTAAEKHQLLIEWNDTDKSYPKDKCLHEIFEQQVERSPDAVAVVFEDRQLTYRELNARANQLGHYLRKLGVKPGVTVGSCMERSMEIVEAILGILKAGGIYLPLDPDYPKERLGFMLNDAQPAVLLAQAATLANVPEHGGQLVCVDHDREKIARESVENLDNTLHFEDRAYVIYTSGSTGKPKGVVISHASIASHCLDVRSHYQLNDSDRVLQFGSVNFDASLEQILPTLISGARLVPRGTEIPTPAALHRQIYDSELTVINLPTTYWHQLAGTTATAPEAFARSKLRLVIVGGEEMLPEAVKLWQQSPHGNARLLNAYGPTEATITATAFPIPSAFSNDLSLATVPIGRPLGNRKLFVLDRHSNLVPIGVPGELHLGGMGLAQGYLNRPELTAEKFIPDSFSSKPGATLYRTGDLVRYLPDGNIEFLGRLDDQVKIRGFRIELGEIENILTQHPAVREVAVLARGYVPGEKRLVAYVATRPPQAVTSTELRKFVAHKVPGYMVPSAFVFLDSMPLTLNGKLDRNALPVADRSRLDPDQRFSTPRNVPEEMLAGIWAEVLKLDQVGINDNFFELGGHSLLATQIVSRV